MGDIENKPSGTHKPLSRKEYRDIYLRYFIHNNKVQQIADDMQRTRVTIARCLRKLKHALDTIRSQRRHVQPATGMIYFRHYTEEVLTLIADQPRRRRSEEKTIVAEQYIQAWWRHQQRESKSKRWMDAKILYQDFYCVSVDDQKEHVSYKTFQRLMVRIIGEAYAPKPGRPKQRTTRGRPRGTCQNRSSASPHAASGASSCDSPDQNK